MGKATLAAGQLAPAFTLRAGTGETVQLADSRGRRIVLYFYPKDDTSGCTKEACGFQGALARLTAAQAVVLGVSCDDEASHRRFADKFHLAFPLLSDPDAVVSKAYGVYKQKSMYGRTYWGIERTTFLIDEQGRIAAVFPRVKVDEHVEEVLRALQSLPASDPAQPPRARTAAR